MQDFIVIAHRGASGNWPENSLLAFRKALEAGATWLELDVHLSADGEIVVLHDEDLQRTTNGQGLVGMKSFAELRGLEVGQGGKDPAACRGARSGCRQSDGQHRTEKPRGGDPGGQVAAATAGRRWPTADRFFGIIIE